MSVTLVQLASVTSLSIIMGIEKQGQKEVGEIFFSLPQLAFYHQEPMRHR